MAREARASAGGDDRRERLKAIIAAKAITREGCFRLASGATSTFYVDMRVVTLDPEGLALIADLVLDVLEREGVAYVGGMEAGAIPIASGVALRSFERGVPIAAFFVRKSPKEHGTRKSIEGNLREGARVALVEDVTTSGGSVLKAVKAVREIGCTVALVVTIVDRLAGAADNLAREGVDLVALFTRDDFPA